ncbi:MAG: PQQ-binding-like beta-propeller repeat protein [Planctomycetota bacterium]
MGQQRDGVYREDGIIDEIPAEGLTVKWRTPIGGGYAGPAVADGKVFVFDYQKSGGEAFNDPGKRAQVQGSERLLVLDASNGNKIWEYSYECPYSISYPAGPRCTPTVDEDRVYLLGSEGDLTCLSVASGDVVWKRSYKNDFSADVPIWGFAGHPLVDGELLICQVGGDGQGVVAFNKRTGEVVWKALDAKAGYCPPSIIEAGGTRQLIIFHPSAVTSLNPTNGNQYWDIPIQPGYDMSIARPMRDGNRLYASAIHQEAVAIELAEDRPAAKELWRGEAKNAVHAGNMTPLFVDGVIYGTDCVQGALMAIDGDNGDRLWQTFEPTKPDEKRFIRHGTAFITRIGDTNRYFLFGELGDLIVASLTPEGYQEHGRFHVLEPTGEAFGRDVVWSHPAYANQTAYARNDKEIVAVSLKK